MPSPTVLSKIEFRVKKMRKNGNQPNSSEVVDSPKVSENKPIESIPTQMNNSQQFDQEVVDGAHYMKSKPTTTQQRERPITIKVDKDDVVKPSSTMSQSEMLIESIIQFLEVEMNKLSLNQWSSYELTVKDNIFIPNESAETKTLKLVLYHGYTGIGEIISFDNIPDGGAVIMDLKRYDYIIKNKGTMVSQLLLRSITDKPQRKGLNVDEFEKNGIHLVQDLTAIKPIYGVTLSDLEIQTLKNGKTVQVETPKVEEKEITMIYREQIGDLNREIVPEGTLVVRYAPDKDLHGVITVVDGVPLVVMEIYSAEQETFVHTLTSTMYAPEDEDEIEPSGSVSTTYIAATIKEELKPEVVPSDEATVVNDNESETSTTQKMEKEVTWADDVEVNVYEEETSLNVPSLIEETVTSVEIQDEEEETECNNNDDDEVEFEDKSLIVTYGIPKTDAQLRKSGLTGYITRRDELMDAHFDKALYTSSLITALFSYIGPKIEFNGTNRFILNDVSEDNPKSNIKYIQCKTLYDIFKSPSLSYEYKNITAEVLGNVITMFMIDKMAIDKFAEDYINNQYTLQYSSANETVMLRSINDM